MDWDDLRVFIAVCQEGSTNAAAERLELHHTTIGRRMSSLEERLGTRLFDRTREGYAMTQAAEEILRRALDMEEAAHAILREKVGREHELRGPLVLTIPYGFANAIVMPQLPAFVARYPGIELEVSTSLEIANLDARDADLALRISKNPPPHLVGRKVMPLRFGVYGEQCALATRGPREVILFRGERERPEWASQLPGASVVCRIDSIVSQYEAVQSGMGVARLPCFLGDANPRLRRLPIEVTTEWGVWVLHHADLRATARVRACRDFLYEVLEAGRARILGEQSTWWEGCLPLAHSSKEHAE